MATLTPAQATNGNNKYYKDASNNVFETGTNRAIALPEFQQLGLNIDHLNPQANSQPNTGASLVPPPLPPAQAGVNTGQPFPTTVQAQPFTNAQPTDPNATPLQPSKFEQGFQKATSAGVSDINSPGQGLGVVQQYAPTQKRDLASTFLQSDPYIDGLVKTFQQYIDPKNQRASLSDTYNQMAKDSGIQGLDMELINTKNVIDGSENDLRNEITKAGGFATDSQVMALTNARNKQLIKNYNTLLDTRNSKEKYLQTMIGLESQDRQAADQRFESMFNMGLQIADYQQKMQQNARQQFQWLQNTVGFDGLYDATGGDPYYTSLVEQTVGLPSGGLLTAANQARQAKAQTEQERQLALQEQQLGLQLKGEQIKTEQAQRSKVYASSGGGTGGGSVGSTSGMSAEAKAIIDGTLRLEDLTPTVRGKIAGELSAAGYKSGPKLSANQQDDLASMQTVSQLVNQVMAYNKDGKLEGIGFGTGPLGATMTKIFGTGSEEAKSVRALVGNIKGTIAKLRGGTSFTPTEQKLLDSYTPSINESPNSVMTKLGLLNDFIQKGRNNLMGIVQDRKVSSGSIDDLRSKYNY